MATTWLHTVSKYDCASPARYLSALACLAALTIT
jgi:hypothetical protein